MKKQFELLKATRQNILELVEDCSESQLYNIPAPFNNHILWNALHVMATDQILIYESSSTPFRMNEDLVHAYKKGSLPEKTVNQEHISYLKNKLISAVDQLEEDYNTGLFGENYNERVTSYGVKLSSVEDAIQFTNLHDAMHFGQMKMIKKMVIDS